MIGQILRHYRIEARLGAGGMGVVYRALDTHLDRRVAIKVLPAAALSNPERKSRFIQEAKTASALNHPNIVTIYDIDAADGIDFIAMEFIAGKTLDQLIGRKGLKLNEILKYAIQIASALSAAHAAGIVHRDLKPANIMVTGQGLVKILDFGLAKLTEPAEPDAFADTQSLHVQEALTEEGAIVGTVSYMSPEQAEGKKLDGRSDIFSFGSILYEMASGQRAFSGGTKLSNLSAILHKEPPPLAEAVEGLPYVFERLVTRCLKKDPQRRWQTAADLKVALEELQDELASGKLAPAEAAPKARARKRLQKWLWPALVGVILGAGGGVYLGIRNARPAPPSFQRLTFRRGDVIAARFAPDGSIIYSAEWDGAPNTIFLTRPGNRESRSLGLPNGTILSINPGGGDMAILLSDQRRTAEIYGPRGTLARAPFGGGAPREILEDVAEADWGADGASLAVVRSVAGRHRLEFPIGKVLYENEWRPPVSPRVSPKGDLLVFFDFDVEAGDYAVTVTDLNGKRRVLSRGWRGAGRVAWSPRGDEIWFSASRAGADPALYGVTLSGRQRLIAQVPGWIILHDVARDGRVLLNAVNTRVGIICLPPGQTKERDLSWLDTSQVYELSRDGKTMVFVELSYGEGRNTAIYTRKTDGSPAIRLGDGARPALSPDGKWILCIRIEIGYSEIVLLPTGPGETRVLHRGARRYESAEWFPDGRRVLFNAEEPGHQVRAYVQDAAGGDPKPITGEGVRATRVSPDSNSVVVLQSGKLYLHPIGDGKPRAICDVAPNESVVRWLEDGSLLLSRRDPSEGAVKIDKLNVSTGRREFWKELKPPEPGAMPIGPVTVTPDGRSYAYSFQRDLTNLYLVQGLR